MVVGDVFGQNPFSMPLVHDDHVVQAVGRSDSMRTVERLGLRQRWREQQLTVIRVVSSALRETPAARL